MTDAAEHLGFECDCGAIAGKLRVPGPGHGDLYVCYCNDCRGFARLLDQEKTLDAAGGSSVYQTRVGNLHIERGLDSLASLNLTGGQTLRWYCETCRTPLFNTTANGRWPFLSMITTSTDTDQREAMLGKPRGSVFVQYATGPDVVTPPVSTFAMVRRVVKRLLADKFSGAAKTYQLFDPDTKEPIATPRTTATVGP